MECCYFIILVIGDWPNTCKPAALHLFGIIGLEGKKIIKVKASQLHKNEQYYHGFSFNFIFFWVYKHSFLIDIIGDFKMLFSPHLWAGVTGRHLLSKFGIICWHCISRLLTVALCSIFVLHTVFQILTYKAGTH